MSSFVMGISEKTIRRAVSVGFATVLALAAFAGLAPAAGADHAEPGECKIDAGPGDPIELSGGPGDELVHQVKHCIESAGGTEPGGVCQEGLVTVCLTVGSIFDSVSVVDSEAWHGHVVIDVYERSLPTGGTQTIHCASHAHVYVSAGGSVDECHTLEQAGYTFQDRFFGQSQGHGGVEASVDGPSILNICNAELTLQVAGSGVQNLPVKTPC